jgi:hypothetical protein
MTLVPLNPGYRSDILQYILESIQLLLWKHLPFRMQNNSGGYIKLILAFVFMAITMSD